MRGIRRGWAQRREPCRAALPASVALTHPTILLSTHRRASSASGAGAGCPACTRHPRDADGRPAEQQRHGFITRQGPGRGGIGLGGGVLGGRSLRRDRDRATATATGASSHRGRPPTPAAAAAFHFLLRQHNLSYVRSPADEAGAAARAAPAHHRHGRQGSESGGPEGLPHRSVRPSRAPGGAPASSCAEAEGASPSEPVLDSVCRDRSPTESPSAVVMREWSLHAAGVRPTSASSPPPTPFGNPPYSTFQGSRRQHGGQQDAQRRRKLELMKQGRLDTAKLLSNRHQEEYERTALHVYQLLKKCESSLFHWGQQRRQQRGRGSSGILTATPSPPSAQPDASVSATAASHAEGDMDAVNARFFEYAGLIQRALHQLTPRHFDAMRAYRLQRTSPPNRQRVSRLVADKGGPSLETAPPQRFHLRLLWRLLHITQLFYAIGRHASLPQSAVHAYVRSANCVYGIREVLRVLGEELSLTSLGLSASPSATSPSSCASLSRDEIFQTFYAALCVSSEEVPGVPIYDPATLSTSDTGASPLLRFQLDCVPTGAVAARMPVDEWCVRWWCHVYAQHNAARSASTKRTPMGSESGMGALPTMGQAMDIIRASLYATTGTETATRASATLLPFVYFETPPRGVSASSWGAGAKRGASPPDNTTSTASAPSLAQQQHLSQRGFDRRYRPRLISALGGDRTRLRIPYHLGQRFVVLFLQHLLSSATASSRPPNPSADAPEGNTGEGGGPECGSEAASRAASGSSAAGVEAAMRSLRHRHGRDAVRDVALLCTAILYFEVFSADTAAFMAYAASLCREQVELLSGHEISCVLLAYASLQRWEGRPGGSTGASHTPPFYRRETKGGDHRSSDRQSSSASRCGRAEADGNRSNKGAKDVCATASVQSASAALNAGQPRSAASHSLFTSTSAPTSETLKTATRASTAAPPEAEVRGSTSSASGGQPAASEDSSASASSSTASSPKPGRSSPSSWDLFYVSLGSRAGQLSDTLSEEDVTRVLRAMELAGLEHEDLRRALESSLRMRNLGRRVLYET
ncbi:hypothetical protein ABL78_6682 [Leptomonas seymouri]|uniref:Uncharacterized protein n=1 Tax=Leptomonas seymouri TaxID=5684 RepID=A0A0N1IHZ5_LEPSE|nr:hypothetical protein ABL78_6682 [Leptomonas seymouri]|eukprot:KPI84268.1 hypothetical protein ABL78_6682 [Leptomonas seymouri]